MNPAVFLLIVPVLIGVVFLVLYLAKIGPFKKSPEVVVPIVDDSETPVEAEAKLECATNFVTALNGLKARVPKWDGDIIFETDGDGKFIKFTLKKDSGGKTEYKLHPTDAVPTYENGVFTGAADVHDYKSDQSYVKNAEYTLDTVNKKLNYPGLETEGMEIQSLPTCFAA